MRLTMMVAGVAMALSVTAGVPIAGAQMGEYTPPGAKVPLGTSVAPSMALNDMLSMYEYQLVAVARAMPADKYDFAPPSVGAAKFDGVRTFAQQVVHLTQANYYFYGSMSGMKPDVDMKAIGTLTKKDDIVAALEKSFVFAHKAVATLTPANAFTSIKPVDGMSTAATIAAFAVAHGYDHYGQLVEYLRMNGVVPPGSK